MKEYGLSNVKSRLTQQDFHRGFDEGQPAGQMRIPTTPLVSWRNLMTTVRARAMLTPAHSRTRQDSSFTRRGLLLACVRLIRTAQVNLNNQKQPTDHRLRNPAAASTATQYLFVRIGSACHLSTLFALNSVSHCRSRYPETSSTTEQVLTRAASPDHEQKLPASEIEGALEGTSTLGLLPLSDQRPWACAAPHAAEVLSDPSTSICVPLFMC
jgi:hypothetical protein